MSFWTSIRDAVESVASVVGNYYLPGSGIVTSQMTSKGSQEQLGSPLGMIAMLGSGGAGAGFGSATTGIPSAADAGYGWGNAYDAVAGTGGPQALGETGGYGASAMDAGGQLSGPGMGSASTGGGAFSGLGDWASNLFKGGSPWATSSTGLNTLASEGGGGGGAGMSSWLSPLMSVGSGLYGLSQAEQQKKLAQQALQGSSPWASSGGMAGAGSALTGAIQGNFTNDPGFALAQRAAAATSSTQPGGYAAKAAADAALQFQNQRIQALSGPAGTGFSPAQGFQTALGGMAQGNALASSSLGSIGFGINQATGGTSAQMPPWLQQYLIQNGLSKGAGA
jgi:hypothetical protein